MVGFDSKHVHYQNLFYPLMIPASGLIVCVLITWYLIRMRHLQDSKEVEPALKGQLIWSTILLVPVLWLTSYVCLPSKFAMLVGDGAVEHSYFDAYKCSLYGLLAGFIIGYFTEVMTSYSYRPVQELAESCRTGAGTNVIYGLALGYLSTIVPVCSLCVCAYLSSTLLGYYGVALAAIGMLANLPICLAIDGYGPISDNAGGIAEMAELGE
jgi:Na+/H+-translocating membrane pyrophosphatase